MKELNNCYYCDSVNVHEFDDRVIDFEKSTTRIYLECIDCGAMTELVYTLESELIAVY